jgi:hypothetical protein
MTMTKDEAHKHKYTKAKYIRLPVDNPTYDGTGKRVLKLVVCGCGQETGKDLLETMPKGKA